MSQRVPYPEPLDDATLRTLRECYRGPDDVLPCGSIHAPADGPNDALRSAVEALAARGLLRYADCYFDSGDVFVEVWIPHPLLLRWLISAPS